MASLLQLFCMLLQFSLIMVCCRSQKPAGAKPHIIYMGRSPSVEKSGSDDLYHLHLLSSLVPSERKSLLRSYNHAFRGFSAMLTDSEASLVSGHEEVVSVFPDPLLQLHTTHSWDFLEEAVNHRARARAPHPHHNHKSADVIIGIIDTGIWPESPSFNDRHIGKIPSKWRGVCQEAADFNKTNCNRKLIGARAYQEGKASPRDSLGHGTHVASTVGGAVVPGASYYGLARGRARGGLPSARIASYRVCEENGCSGGALLKAIDDAVKDGVDIISISVGTNLDLDFLSDPIAIGAFHAQEKGVMVVCSAGNNGPNPYTVENSAPWIFTVAASSLDRAFHSEILLGNGRSYKGTAINFSPLKHDERYPLAMAEAVAANSTPSSDARNCLVGSLDPEKARGKIIVCLDENSDVRRVTKRLVAEEAGAKGVIIVNREGLVDPPQDGGTFPFADVEQHIGFKILHYINSTKNPTATITAAREVKGFRPAPVVAPFSSRGPGTLTENILKPDVMAPGVAILAASLPVIPQGYKAPGNRTTGFRLRSGTSMACPHVSGAAAFLKSVHPHWSPSIIKSALITTASISNNIGRSITNTTYRATNPHESGAGEISPMKALDPGLVIETTTKDHMRFLCYYGYTQKQMSLLTHTKFSCPKSSAKDLIPNINYPTISIAALKRGSAPTKVKRVVTNIGPPNATYVASVNAPPGLRVTVVPREIVFGPSVRKASFKVVFDAKRASKGYKYGDVSWCHVSRRVRLVFAVNVQ